MTTRPPARWQLDRDAAIAASANVDHALWAGLIKDAARLERAEQQAKRAEREAQRHPKP